MRTTRYFEEQVLRKRAYIQREWCERALYAAVHREATSKGRIHLWVFVPELGTYLRVVTLRDGQTVHDAFLDRRFEEKSP
jgi:hypothetical protein